MPTFVNDGGPDDGVQGITADPHHNGVFGRNNSTTARNAVDPGGNGVFGFTQVPDGAGVFGAHNTGGIGVSGIATGGDGAIGISGSSDTGHGIQGITHAATKSGVRGAADGNGTGMLAQSDSGSGLVATSKGGQGISAFSDNDIAIFAQGATFSGVFNGPFVVNKGPKDSDINGSLVINDGNLFLNKGDIFLANAADCAEDFGLSEGKQIEPGTVVVLDGKGRLAESTAPYDKRVAGVISGAGDYKPGLVLDRKPSSSGRVPLALIGKAYCKVDASHGSVEVGDMLTTSSTPGHAMKATDASRAFGSVIGKALASLEGGRGLVPILISLQ